MRIEDGTAGRDIELPAMPGTAHDLAIARPDIFTGFARHRHSLERPQTERSSLMWAPIAQRVVCPLDIADADRASIHFDDLPPAGGNFTHSPDHMPSHPPLLMRARTTRARSRRRCADVRH